MNVAIGEADIWRFKQGSVETRASLALLALLESRAAQDLLGHQVTVLKHIPQLHPTYNRYL